MTTPDPYPLPDAPALTTRYVCSRRWMARAACAHSALPPDAWFPERGTDPALTAAAVGVCRLRCPVWEECAAYALVSGHCSGIVAGLPLGPNRTNNAVALRAALAGSDLADDLETVIDDIVDTRMRRRADRTGPGEPMPLSALLTECAPVRPVPDGREVA